MRNNNIWTFSDEFRHTGWPLATYVFMETGVLSTSEMELNFATNPL